MKKKTAKKRRAPKSRVKKVGKKLMAKAGVNKATVKKKVVKKLKRVGVAMARAAMDELMPASDDTTAPGGPAAKAGAGKGRASPR
jgi:hypothetical protein